MFCYVLFPFSLMFYLIVQIRRVLYAVGLFRRKPLHCPSVCVGNITAGGTGKTPICIFLMNHFLKMGNTPLVLLRGYKGSGETCDEAEIYKMRIQDCLLGLGADRRASAARYPEANIAIMDDGLQHLSVRPTVTVAVIDSLNPFGNGMLLPAGRLREPVHSLRTYDIIVFSRTNLISPESLTALRSRLDRLCPETLCVESAQRITAFQNPFTREQIKPEDLSEEKTLAFCGIGNPESFRQSLIEVGLPPEKLLVYSDHHAYSRQDADRIRAEASRHDTAVILTTEKDIGKITPFFGDAQNIRLYHSVLDVEFIDSVSFTGHINRLLEERKAAQ